MKRWAYWLCALLAALVSVWLFYRYGVSPLSLLLSLLLLSCPVFVVWLTLSQARQTKHDIEEATRQELAHRSRSKSGNTP